MLKTNRYRTDPNSLPSYLFKQFNRERGGRPPAVQARGKVRRRCHKVRCPLLCHLFPLTRSIGADLRRAPYYNPSLAMSDRPVRGCRESTGSFGRNSPEDVQGFLVVRVGHLDYLACFNDKAQDAHA
jgi:hypothetical protein